MCTLYNFNNKLKKIVEVAFSIVNNVQYVKGINTGHALFLTKEKHMSDQFAF